MRSFYGKLVLLLCVLLAGVACGYSEEEMQVKRDRIDQLTRTLNTLEQEHQALRDRFNAVSEKNAQLADRLRQMGMSMEDSKRSMQQLNEMVEELRERERQAQARLQTFQNMLEKFKKMIESGQLRVRIVRNRMVVELAEDILFDSGKANLKPEGKAALTEVAKVLASIKDRDFQIAGHTDNIPIRSRRFPSNWELSTARAVTVTRFLQEQGVHKTRLSAAGYADTQPVESNETPEGRAQNRRIEIVLMPNLDELPDLSSLQES